MYIIAYRVLYISSTHALRQMFIFLLFRVVNKLQ